MQVGNPFVDDYNLQKPVAAAQQQLFDMNSQQNPDYFKLPASSPYDNFLKAAGC